MGDARVGTSKSRGDRIRSKLTSATPAGHTLNGERIQLAACNSGGLGYYAKLYDGLNCTDQMLAMVSRDIINNMGTYGFDNKTSSFWLGECIVSLKLFKDNNLTGVNYTYGGGGQAYSAIAFNNQASSASTPGSNC